MLFVEMLRIVQQMGVARIGKFAVDGTKVQANASKRKAMSYDYMKRERVRLQAEIDELTGRAAQADEEEDQQYGGREKRLASNDAHNSAVRQRMREKLRTADGRTLYGQRKWLSEASNGWIKQVLGFRQFSRED